MKLHFMLAEPGRSFSLAWHHD